MQPARGLAGALGHGGRERNHIVLRRLLDFLDAGDVERRALAKNPRVFGRDDTRGGERIGGRQLDLEPGTVPPFLTPDGAHLRTRIPGNHLFPGDVVPRTPIHARSRGPRRPAPLTWLTRCRWFACAI